VRSRLERWGFDLPQPQSFVGRLPNPGRAKWSKSGGKPRLQGSWGPKERKERGGGAKSENFLERQGIEPGTSCKRVLVEKMLSKRSTPELHPHQM
jgi:hypothetical protein